MSELGKSLCDGKFARIPCVNAGDERVYGLIKKFVAESTDNKFGDGFFFAIATRSNEWLAKNGELRFGREKIGSEKAKRRAGHGDRPSVTNDVTRFGVGSGIEFTRFEAGVPDEL
jgi:hypothetical protein